MNRLLTFSSLTLSLCVTATAQTVLPPYNDHYQAIHLGQMPGVYNYAGIAFPPNDPNRLLVSAYQSGQIRSVPLLRDTAGHIVGFGPSTLYVTVGGTDGGLAFGPGGVLFFTWYGQNKLGQIRPGSTTVDRVDNLGPLGIPGSVGTCAFVPAGHNGAGRFKIASYAGSQWYDVTLSPDGNGTFDLQAITNTAQIQGGPEGILYPPAGSPLLPDHVLVAEWNAGLTAYQVDPNGDPLPATRQLVMAGFSGNSGGASDPVTGDMLFAGNGGRLAVLRAGATCGAITSYGLATPGSSVTPMLTGTGCARLGQTVTLRIDGAPNAFGVLAMGYYSANYQFQGLTVLQSMDVVLTSVLGGTGVMIAPLALPADPRLGNQHFYFQAGYLDATTPSGLSATAGLDLWVR